MSSIIISSCYIWLQDLRPSMMSFVFAAKTLFESLYDWCTLVLTIVNILATIGFLKLLSAEYLLQFISLTQLILEKVI